RDGLRRRLRWFRHSPPVGHFRRIGRLPLSSHWPFPSCTGLSGASIDVTVIPMPGGWGYIITNKPNVRIHVGETANLRRRAWEHREGVVDGFTTQYGLKRLVYAERHEDIRDAIHREKRLKHWPRQWKINLIEARTTRIGRIFTKCLVDWMPRTS